MQHNLSRSFSCLGLFALLAVSSPAWAITGIQVGPSGKTYASADVQCTLHPVNGMSPMVQAGLYNPKKNISGTVALNGTPVALVSFISPDATVWLANGLNTVDISINRKVADSYQFDASLTFPGQPNVCIPDTRGNSVDIVNDLETALSGKSTTTVTPGCALNLATGRAQPWVNISDNGKYLLNVSVNNVALTQLNGVSRIRAVVFLSPGLNVISATDGALTTDYFVRDGGTGSCALP